MDNQQELVDALRYLAELQKQGDRVFHTKHMIPSHRARLHKAGYLKRIIKGWWRSDHPGSLDDSMMWNATFWEFCSKYANHRFGSDWYLSPDDSLLIHAEKTSISKQTVLHTKGGGNNKITLPNEGSIFLLEAPLVPRFEVTQTGDLRVLKLETALISASPSFFKTHPLEARTALLQVRQDGPLIQTVISGRHARKGGRLIAAFAHIGRSAFAKQLRNAMLQNGLRCEESNPFSEEDRKFGTYSREARSRSTQPITERLRLLWDMYREEVVSNFSQSPGLLVTTSDKASYLQAVKKERLKDAYHSLSIEGYDVSLELIEKVARGDYNPNANTNDEREHNAMAAKGYLIASDRVHLSLERILQGENPSRVCLESYQNWYRGLFEPMREAGLYGDRPLEGYRTRPVFLIGSQHVPPRVEVVPDAMATLFDLFEEENEASVRAVLGHWMFGYVHPFPDGNGRTARFLMNAMLASGGYPWTVIKVDDRQEYLQALESASVGQSIRPFARFVDDRVCEHVREASASTSLSR